MSTCAVQIIAHICDIRWFAVFLWSDGNIEFHLLLFTRGHAQDALNVN